jgi:hypothetical protein
MNKAAPIKAAYLPPPSCSRFMPVRHFLLGLVSRLHGVDGVACVHCVQSLALLLFGSTVAFLRYRQPPALQYDSHRSAPAGNLWQGIGGAVISSPTPSCILQSISWTLVCLRVRSRRKRLKSRREREHSNYCLFPAVMCGYISRDGCHRLFTNNLSL